MGPEPFDATIIGSGISGLGLAALLGGAGRKVLVLEKARHLGGRAYSFEQRGHITNIGGPRAGIADRRVDALFARVNREVGERGFFESTIHFRDGRFTDLAALASEAPAEEVLRYFEMIQGVTDDDLPALDAVSAREWITGRIQSPELLHLSRLGAIVMSTLPRLEDIAASTMVQALRITQDNPRIFLTAHGYGDFMRILAEAATEAGAEIRTSAAVTRILVEHGVTRGVVVEYEGGRTERIAASTVVTAFPIWEILGLVDEALVPPQFVEQVRHLDRRTAIIGVTAALPEPLYEGKKFILDDARRVGLPFAGFMASNVAPTLSPEGEHLFEACCQCDIELGDNTRLLNKAIGLLKEDIDEMFPGWEKRALWVKPYFHWEEPARNPGREGIYRPGASLDGVDGLYFTGDTVSSRALPGLECAADSAMICADTILSSPAREGTR